MHESVCEKEREKREGGETEKYETKTWVLPKKCWDFVKKGIFIYIQREKEKENFILNYVPTNEGNNVIEQSPLMLLATHLWQA